MIFKPQIEKYVLASVIFAGEETSKGLAYELIGALSECDFYTQSGKEIYRALVQCVTQGLNVDLVSMDGFISDKYK